MRRSRKSMRQRKRQVAGRKLKLERLEQRVVLDGSGFESSLFQNPVDPLDVDGNGERSANDAIELVNRINRGISGPLADLFAPPILAGRSDQAIDIFADVVADGELAPNDVLRVVSAHNGFTEIPIREAVATGAAFAEFPSEIKETTPLSDDGYAAFRIEPSAAQQRGFLAFDAVADRIAVQNAGDAGEVQVLNDKYELLAKLNLPPNGAPAEPVSLPVNPGERFYVGINFPDADPVENPGDALIEVFNHNDQWNLFTDSDQGNDAHADKPTDATWLTLDGGFTSLASHFDGADVDTFGLNAVAGNLQVNLDLPQGNGGASLEIVDTLGSVIATSAFNEHGARVKVDIDVPPGDYFINLAGINEPYVLDVVHSRPFDEVLGIHPNADSEKGDDIHGDTFETATVVELGPQGTASLSSWIDAEEDADVFRFDTVQDRPNIVFVSANAAWHHVGISFELFDEEGNSIEGQHVTPFGLPNWGQFQLDPGTYFVKVTGGEDCGRYNLEIGAHPIPGPTPGTPGPDPNQNPNPAAGFLPDDAPTFLADLLPIALPSADAEKGNDVHGDTIAEATPIEVDETGLILLGSNLDTETDVDVFSFVAAASSIVLGAHGAKFDLDVQISLLDADGTAVGSTGDVDDLRLSYVHADLTVGDTYFIVIEGIDGDCGHYRVEGLNYEVADLPLPPADSEQGDDIHGDDISDATPLSLDSHGKTSLSSWLDEAGDADVFLLDLEAGHFSASLIPLAGGDVELELLDQDGDVIAAGNGELFGQFLDHEVAEGTHYLRISGDEPTQYILDISFEETFPIPRPPADSEFGDDPHVDTANDPNDPCTAIDVSNFGFTGLSSFIDSAGDVDVFCIEQSGYLTVAAHSFPFNAMPMEITLLNEDLEEITNAAFAGGFPGAGGFGGGLVDGVTYIVVQAANGTDTGQYLLDVFVGGF